MNSPLWFLVPKAIELEGSESFGSTGYGGQVDVGRTMMHSFEVEIGRD